MSHRNVLGIGITGKTLTDLERRVLDETTPYAVILFARNVGTAEELVALVREIKSYGERPPIVVIDEEGGRVDRLRELIPGIPGPGELAQLDEAESLARRLGERVGEALRHFGVDVNLAPVVDVERDEPVKGLERRTWGRSADPVVKRSRAFMRGQHALGIGSCLKHFPGLGAGHGDPHYGASVVNVSTEELERVDLVPYRELASEAGAVMIGHSLYPAIEDPDLPASLSRRISTGLLREVLGFEGLSFSDDMEMHAVSDLASFEEIGERAIQAGSDVVFFCSQIERVPGILEHLERRLEADSAFGARYEQALDRAEGYRDHCKALRAKSREAGGLEEIRAGVAELRRELGDVLGAGERGVESGTGRTGREEWT